MASIKRTICAAVILSCACMAACDEDAAVKIKSYAALCEASGGTMDNGKCRCANSLCEAGIVCMNGKCASERECDPKNYQLCHNKDKVGYTRECVNGLFGKEMQCAGGFSCNKEGSECGECRDDAQECVSDDAYKTCKDGKWEANADGVIIHTSCSGKLSVCDQGMCKEKCQAGTTQCTDNDNIVEVKTCSDGAWVELKSCDDVSCNAKKTDCGDCLSGKYKCENEKGVGKVTRCEKGKWQSENQSCLNDRPCKKSAADVASTMIGDSPESVCACHAGDHECQGNTAFNCENGEWKKESVVRRRNAAISRQRLHACLKVVLII